MSKPVFQPISCRDRYLWLCFDFLCPDLLRKIVFFRFEVLQKSSRQLYKMLMILLLIAVVVVIAAVLWSVILLLSFYNSPPGTLDSSPLSTLVFVTFTCPSASGPSCTSLAKVQYTIDTLLPRCLQEHWTAIRRTAHPRAVLVVDDVGGHVLRQSGRYAGR